jgi:flagellar hook-associated protein 3 FlgL
MSGTLNSVYSNVAFALRLHSNAMLKLQEQAATGSRINRPSDDPSSAYRILGLNSQKRYLANFIQNIDNTISTQEMAASVLSDMSTTLTGTMVHLTQIISGTYGEGEDGQNARNRVALQINDVLEQMVASANTRHVNQYIFGGDNTSQIPYQIERQNGQIVSVTYQGSTSGRSIEVTPGVQAYTTFSGGEIFHSNSRKPPVFYGTTGAAPGSGTSSVKGDQWLTVTHDGTNYKLSIDDGVTEVTVPNSGDISNIAVINANGDVLYVNAAEITSVGTERVRIPGTYDIFNTLITTRDLLNNSRGLSDDFLAQLVDEAAKSVEEIKIAIVGKESSIGTRINFLDSLKDSMESIKFNSDDETAMLEEADIANIAIDLSRRQALYEMSLTISGRLMSMSLLNFLR